MSDPIDPKIKVLIVDDSAVMRKIISSALSKEPSIEILGYASNGVQAIESVRTLKPDVVTLDIEMPEMDGLTALKEIRKENKRLPIIMFSTLTHKGAQAAVMALTAGASDYVGKPTTSAGSIEGAFKVLENELIPKIIGLARSARLRKVPTEQKSSSRAELAPTREKEPPARSIPVSSSLRAPSQQFVPNKPISAVCSGIDGRTNGPNAGF